MAAYYNEFDPYAAQWLRNLIAAGHIAPGDVDERSIEDVRPSELRGYTQCHFFAGIGVWSYALRRAGWSDDRPVWTGSCPCQPFSAAGKGTGFDDERHLWPHWQHLIKECAPAIIFGEQVASSDAGPWLDLVHDDLEDLGYAFGAIPFPSAGVGAPHIRDRLYWMANTGEGKRGRRPFDGTLLADRKATERQQGASHVKRDSRAIGLAETELHNPRSQTMSANNWESEIYRSADWSGRRGILSDRLADTNGSDTTQEHEGNDTEYRERSTDRRGAELTTRTGAGSGIRSRDSGAGCNEIGIANTLAGMDGPGPTNGFWRDADWLGCTDGKWRPVEPGTFPLATGAISRVGRLRAYGNAINAEAARVFIEAAMSVMP